MKKALILMTLLCVTLFSGTAFGTARFTGLMEMMLKMPGGNADVTYYFGTGAQRMDMVMNMTRIPDPLKTTVITKAGRPDEAILINHEAKSYSVVNLRTAAESATLLDFDSNYKLKKLGKAVIKGYQCEHISLTSTTEKLELWVSTDLGDFSTFRILQSQNPRLSNTALSRTLKETGVEGFPVKIVQQNDNGVFTMQLTSIKPRELASSIFGVPRGYSKTEVNSKPVSGTQKEHLRNLMEKMKKFEE